jgi:hypothetical protein
MDSVTEHGADALTPPVPNLPLLRKVLDHIDAHPEEYEQSIFRTRTKCGTAYCIAGHVAVMTGATFANAVEVETSEGDRIDVAKYAQQLLGITSEEAWLSPGLFAGDSTRREIQTVAERIAARAGERL